MTTMAGLLAGASCLPASAEATVTTTTYDFAGHFSTGPYSSLSGTFTLDYNTVTDAYTLDALALTIGGFQYTTANSGVLIVGSSVYVGATANSVNGINTLNGTKNDFYVNFGFNSATGALGGTGGFAYVAPGTIGILHDFGATASAEASPTPEPATWAMFIGGFGLIGGALRRRQNVSVRFA
jgi:hypothetical protein